MVTRSVPEVFRARKWELPIGRRTYVMGILNMTPDSFSGDGLESNVAEACRRGEEMLAGGADILDIGGESTRPGAEEVPAEEEARRLLPVVREMAAQGALVSIDTRKASVAEQALEEGAAIINDVTALTGDPAMLPLAAASGAGVCLMHMLGEPRTMQAAPYYDGDVVVVIGEYLLDRALALEAAGIARERVLVDAGIGFGKTVEHNLELVNHLGKIRAYTGQPVLLGASRKAFIGKILDLPVEERLNGTAAVVAVGIARGADIVRVHDVREIVQVCRMADALVRR